MAQRHQLNPSGIKIVPGSVKFGLDGTDPEGLKFNGRKALSQVRYSSSPTSHGGCIASGLAPASSGARPSSSPAYVNSQMETATAEAPATIIIAKLLVR